MSAIDDVNKALKSLAYLPTYTLRKVRHYCPVDNNVDRPENQRLRASFKVHKHSDELSVIESNSPYLVYVVHGRGPLKPLKPHGSLRWRAGTHGNGNTYPRTRVEGVGRVKDGYFYSYTAKAVMPNPFIDKAYWDVMNHISNRSLQEIAYELEIGVSDFDISVRNNNV